MLIELIRWIKSDDLPDSDTTVLISCPQEDPPVFVGFHDGVVWRNVYNEYLGTDAVKHWAHLPGALQLPQNGQEFASNLIETAWGLLANAGGGDWGRESPEWADAAGRWRDDYYKLLAWMKAGAKAQPEGIDAV